jgi:rare lipoprotein A
MRAFRRFTRFSVILAVPTIMAACATKDDLPPAPTSIGDGTIVQSKPKGGWGKGRDPFAGQGSPRGVEASPHRKVGNPYKVAGIWYYPEEDATYSRTGKASWYGPKFHGRKTANGEIFDMNQFSAAHPTLPLPSIVKVTNLENGRFIHLRLNDRGPFAHNRIIDLSRAAARQLGFEGQGLADVRVEYIRPATLDNAIVAVKDADDLDATNERLLRIAAANPDMDTVRTRIATGPELDADGDMVVEETIAQPEFAATGDQEDLFENAVADETAGTVTTVAFPDQDKPVNPAEMDRITVKKAAPVAPKRKPRLAASSARTEGIFLVQVGAYSSADNADRAADRFGDSIPVRTARIERDNGQWLYRVRLGPYSSRQEADAALKIAQNTGFADAAVVRP